MAPRRRAYFHDSCALILYTYILDILVKHQGDSIIVAVVPTLQILIIQKLNKRFLRFCHVEDTSLFQINIRGVYYYSFQFVEG